MDVQILEPPAKPPNKKDPGPSRHLYMALAASASAVFRSLPNAGGLGTVGFGVSGSHCSNGGAVGKS